MSKPSPSSSSSIPTSTIAAAMLRPHQAHMSENIGFTSTLVATSTTGSGLVLSSHEDIRSGFGYGLASFENKAAAVSPGVMEQIATNAAGGAGGPSHLVHDMMSSLSSASGLNIDGSSFDQGLNGMLNPKRDSSNFQQILSKSKFSRSTDHEGRAPTAARTTAGGSSHGGGNDGLTRDFLGLKAFPHKDLLNIARLDHINSSTFGQRNQSQPSWQA